MRARLPRQLRRALAACALLASSAPAAAQWPHAEAPEPETLLLSLGVKSGVDWWRTSMLRHDHVRYGSSGSYWDPETELSERARAGALLGPELELWRRSFFLRASYLWSRTGLAGGGTVTRGLGAADLGVGRVGGAYLGLRHLSQSFDRPADPRNVDRSGTDVVLGFFAHTPPDRPGLAAAAELAAGLQGWLGVFDRSRFYESSMYLQVDGSVGYRFASPPLAASVGYAFRAYQQVIRRAPSPAYLVSDRAVWMWNDWGQGPTLDLSWRF